MLGTGRSGRLICAIGVSVALVDCTAIEPGTSGRDARAFIEMAEARLVELWVRAERANWIQQNFISEDTAAVAAIANAEVMAATVELASEAALFDQGGLSGDVRRKLLLLKTSVPAVAPSDAALQQELADILVTMEAEYGRGRYCGDDGDECVDLSSMERTMAESRDTDELLELWDGWRKVSQSYRDKYQRFVEIANAGAVELGFADTGEMWRSGYDMTPEDFRGELERLWFQVRPLYESVHCLVRAELGNQYGTAIVPPGEPIPAHLLGNMWSQTWGNVYAMVEPSGGSSRYDLSQQLERNGIDAVGMVRYGERFFSSLGFPPLPETFWERSLFVRPMDRDVVCHASAWNLDFKNDVRIKMCIGINNEDFITVHHELGHNYYQRAYQSQDVLYRTSANDGFHEAIGDTIALSITPEYLVKVGLLRRTPSEDNDIGLLLRQALDKVAFLPFGLLVDQWRWRVFSGEITQDTYNASWWDLREQYQGVRSSLPRDESDFDAGAKYHVPANVPYTRYFLAHILQFQFHSALCNAAGFEGPLHRCSIFESREAGSLLREMLEMGASRPWPDALEVIAGTRRMDATAILDYFAPLQAWLDEQNMGRQCGW